jgi:hypothetical protein
MNFTVTLDQQPFYIGKILPINNLKFKSKKSNDFAASQLLEVTK